jgi:hypothetical protein
VGGGWHHGRGRLPREGSNHKLSRAPRSPHERERALSDRPPAVPPRDVPGRARNPPPPPHTQTPPPHTHTHTHTKNQHPASPHHENGGAPRGPKAPPHGERQEGEQEQPGRQQPERGGAARLSPPPVRWPSWFDRHAARPAPAEARFEAAGGRPGPCVPGPALRAQTDGEVASRQGKGSVASAVEAGA